MSSSRITLIAAVAANGAIGANNQLLWHLPADMQHFRELTAGHVVIMGRKTWESLPERFRPLPKRRNLVISRNAAYPATGAEVFTSLPDALKACEGAEKVFVIGGAEIYAHALPLADCLEMTELHAAYEGDAFFPPIHADEWQVLHRDCRSDNGIDFDFVTYERRR